MKRSGEEECVGSVGIETEPATLSDVLQAQRSPHGLRMNIKFQKHRDPILLFLSLASITD